MKRILTYEISPSDLTCEGLTIERFLKKEGYSHPVIVQLKKTPESILKNGVWSYVRTPLEIGDKLTVTILETQNSEHIPLTPISEQDFSKLLVYEDEDILVLNKPAGLPVHPSLGHYEDTLANYCAYYYREQGGFLFRCINRLDRDTSGLVLIAKHMLSGAVLSVQQLQRQIHRTYLAIAEGVTPSEGTITAPIARKKDSIIERCVDYEQGESAITHYQRLCTASDSRQQPYSLLSIQLETGRTHQIRVHMKEIGHPLPGDFLYHPDTANIKRQALHSYRLEFDHPITHKPLSFTAPIPEDFLFISWNLPEPY